VSQHLRAEVRAAIQQKRFSAVIVDQIKQRGASDFLRDEIEANYRQSRRILNSEVVFYPVTGLPTRPQFVYVPR
jgi:hypothetical protein